MPNVITHGLMAQDVVGVLDESRVADAIQTYPQLFLLGSNGPDYLFYYRFLSSDQDATHIRNIGSIFHSSHVNDFYRAGFDYLISLENDREYDMFLSYLSGHLCHWALDTLGHPYIFHKTGLLQGKTRYDHYRFESMIDTLMVTQIKKDSLKNYPTYKFADLNTKERLVIAKGYQFITKTVLNERVALSKFNQALKEMYYYTRLLYDPNGFRIKLVQLIEKNILKDLWFISSHIVSKKLDTQRDILNLSHSVWNHPSDDTMIFTDSFVDLYNQSIQRGKIVLELLDDKNIDGLLSYIDNRNYETGLNTKREMKYFNLVYQS